MTTLEKAARAPSEEARKLADMLWWILGSGGSAREGAITEAAAHIDDYVSKRLLDPSDEVVNTADREFWATEGPTCVRMRAALRAAGVKITGKD